MKKINFILISGLILLGFLFSCQREDITENVGSKKLSPMATTTPNNAINVPNNEYYVVDSLGKKEQFFSEYASAELEKDRLQLMQKPSDFLPTGLYLEANQKLTLNVEQISGYSQPKLLIGTYGRNGAGTTPQEVNLVLGENKITADDKGGLLWIRYGSNNTSPSTGKVKITFENGYKTAPLFIKNKTDLGAFASQISKASEGVKDALLIGQKAYVVLQKEQKDLGTQNNNSILEKIDTYAKIQEDLTGLDNSSSIHAPTKTPQLYTICIPAHAGGWAWDYVTATSYDVTDNYMYYVRHEFGHKRQQSWVVQQETIGQFFTIVTGVINNMPVDGFTEGFLGNWDNVWQSVNDYFKKPDKERDYTKAEEINLPNLLGKGYLASVMYIQLKLAFGNDFYQKLFKATRENKPVFSNDDAKYKYFMLQACKITGTDLSDFFKKWGFNFPDAYITIAAMKLPKPSIDPSTLTTDPNRNLEKMVNSNSVDIESGATYQLISAVNNTSVLDVAGASILNGTQTVLWRNNSTDNQKWIITSVGNGYYKLSPKHAPSMALDLTGGVNSNLTPIQIYKVNGTDAQKWKFTSVGNGYVTISPAIATSSNILVSGGSSQNGSSLFIYTSLGGVNAEKWKLVKL